MPNSNFLEQIRQLEAAPFLQRDLPSLNLNQIPFLENLDLSDFVRNYQATLESPTTSIKKIPFRNLPEDINTYSYYIPDFLRVSTPYQYPERYRESLAAYAGRPSVEDPMAEIRDVFLNALKYGIYQPPGSKSKKQSAEDIAKRSILGASTLGLSELFGF